MLPGGCTHDDAAYAVQPALTMVCRQTRAEALPLFYANNRFIAHIHRFDTAYFTNYIFTLSVLGRKHLHKVELLLAGERDRYLCGAGLLDVVRFATTTTGRERIKLMVTAEIGDAIDAYSVGDALRLADGLFAERQTTEARLRKAFDRWLEDQELDCASCCMGENESLALCSNIRDKESVVAACAASVVGYADEEDFA